MSRLKTLHFHMFVTPWHHFNCHFQSVRSHLEFLIRPMHSGPINPISDKWTYFFSRSIKQAGGRPSGPVLMWLTSRSCRPSSIYFHIFIVFNHRLIMHIVVHVVIWDVHPSIPSSFFIISLINLYIHSCNVGADCLLACLLPCLFSILACLNCLLDFSYFACLLCLRAWCMLSFSAACPCMDTMITGSYNRQNDCLILYPHITSLYLGTCSVWGDQRSVFEMLVHSGDQPLRHLARS